MQEKESIQPGLELEMQELEAMDAPDFDWWGLAGALEGYGIGAAATSGIIIGGILAT
ncbi:hypothetical protein ABIE67_009881 [Streptomyces sp. V4I8]|uniref:daptide-type RiPP n=1 Tax=Streptomyces sp. V4I8 TaxID=3156469 RepID=UPI00351782A0